MKLLLLGIALLSSFTTFAAPATSLTLADSRHILTRTGIGASPSEIHSLLGLTRRQAVTKIVNGLNTLPQSEPPEWTNNPAPYHWRLPELSTIDKQQFRRARYDEMQQLRSWWVQEMISTTNPQTERLLLFWHNHFVTGFSAINQQAIAIARQHTMLREYGSGNFRHLLKQVIRDPAMLNYLDNNTNNKGKPNENLARELMELFTLGEGNYTEQDVKNAARALTGYGVLATHDHQFKFKGWAHDKGEKNIFDQSGNFDGDDLIDLILEQPAAARFISAKFWRALIGDINPADDRLTLHAAAFRQSDYDIKTLYKSILLSDDFWLPENRATIVQSPIALTIGTIRSTGLLPPDWQTLPSSLTQMGQTLFDPPNVAGWPGGKAWISPGRLLTRLEWLKSLDSETAATSAQTDTMTMMSANNTDMQSVSSQNSMQSDTDSMATAATMIDNTKQLQVRLASEEFDGHVKYSVTLFGAAGPLWESGDTELSGGHNTQHMGRIDQRNMPWQQISFPIDIDESNVTAVEVAFLNDKTAPPNADRNLFVNQVSLGDRTWLSSQGKQDTTCVRKKQNQQGHLYCAGHVRMEKSKTTDNSTTATLNPNTLRVGGVYLQAATTPGKSHGTLAYTLSDVELDDRYWNTITVRYILDKKGNYSIRLNDTDCWPDCVQQWPECAWSNEYGEQTLSLPVNANKNQQCMYDDLNSADKKLIRALWGNAQGFYTAASNSVKIKRPRIEKSYKQWQTDVSEIENALLSSPYSSGTTNDAIKLKVAPRPIADAILSKNITTPLPASDTATARKESLARLQKKYSKLKLYDLLLPSPPLNVPVSPTPSLNDVITDLAYQLK